MDELVCKDVDHSYDGVHNAVSGLEFSVRRGEVLALIGPNGAGKSTTLRILATLQRPDRGTVLWDGRDTWPERFELRRRIGFLGDGTALYPDMTANVYLRFFAECYGQSDAQAKDRVARILEMFELEAKADAPIRSFSKGMRQRLAVARTLVHEPELLLLDEPADGIDPRARRQLRTILRDLAKTGVGIVISSHILRELDGFVDAVAVVQRGRLEVFGPVDEVIETYEVGRRLHEIHVSRGLQQALATLRCHEGLIESVEPLQSGEIVSDAASADRGQVRVRIHGPEEQAAYLLRTLVEAGVDVIAFTKVRSDLEDLYQSMGREDVS